MYKNFIKIHWNNELDGKDSTIKLGEWSKKSCTFRWLGNLGEIIEMHVTIDVNVKEKKNTTLCQNMLNKHNAGAAAWRRNLHWTTHKSDIKWSYAHIKIHQQIIVIKYLTNRQEH